MTNDKWQAQQQYIILFRQCNKKKSFADRHFELLAQ